jgi:hypothetical protein
MYAIASPTFKAVASSNIVSVANRAEVEHCAKSGQVNRIANRTVVYTADTASKANHLAKGEYMPKVYQYLGMYYVTLAGDVPGYTCSEAKCHC